MKTDVSLILLILALCSCTLSDLFSSRPDQADSKDIITIEEGETATLSVFDARLTFVRKTSDSRCPVDVICVWEGEATVLLSLSVANQPSDSFSMSTWRTDSQNQDEEDYPLKDTLGFRFTLLDVRPYPDTRVPEPGPSILDLRVERP